MKGEKRNPTKRAVTDKEADLEESTDDCRLKKNQ